MSKPFDATTKRLLEAGPTTWLEYIGLPGTDIELINIDLTTILADADKALLVKQPVPYLAHLEFQASHKTDMDERMLEYGVLFYRRYKLPVQSVVILLRREAGGSGVTGMAGFQSPGGGSLDFRYQIVRVWERPVEELLAGGLATLPLSPISAVAPEALPEVIRRMEERIEKEAPPEDMGMLWTATYLLMGLKYDPKMAQFLLRGVRAMKESTTYQAILEEGEAIGEAKEARKLLLRMGTNRFGEPDTQTHAAVEAIHSLEQLEALAVNLLEAESWEELLRDA